MALNDDDNILYEKHSIMNCYCSVGVAAFLVYEITRTIAERNDKDDDDDDSIMKSNIVCDDEGSLFPWLLLEASRVRRAASSSLSSSVFISFSYYGPLLIISYCK